jgi:WhiB family redox-sensing transcriptional regulator
MARAACGGRGDDLFFPPGYTACDAQVELARMVCLGCPVLRACRTWALEVPETEGIWGATTPAERRTLRRTHRKEAVR